MRAGVLTLAPIAGRYQPRLGVRAVPLIPERRVAYVGRHRIGVSTPTPSLRYFHQEAIPKMKAEFVNAFLTPALDVWKKELGEELTYHGAHAVTGTFTTEDLTAIIGVTGGLKGNVFYEFSNATSLAIAGVMCGSPFEELDEVGMSAIGELANIITGNATVELAAANYVCDISPPVLLSRGARVSVTNPQIRASFESAMGVMSIRIGLTEGTALRAA